MGYIKIKYLQKGTGVHGIHKNQNLQKGTGVHGIHKNQMDPKAL